MKKLLATFGVAMALSGVGGTIVNIQTAEARSYVVIAPRYGSKAHHSRHCRGLNHAKKLRTVTAHWAKHHHHPKCRYC